MGVEVCVTEGSIQGDEHPWTIFLGFLLIFRLLYLTTNATASPKLAKEVSFISSAQSWTGIFEDAKTW